MRKVLPAEIYLDNYMIFFSTCHTALITDEEGGSFNFAFCTS